MAEVVTRSEAKRPRDVLMGQAAELAESGDGPSLARELSDYYRQVADEDVLTRRPQELLGVALSHRETAQQRPVGTASVRAFTPTVEGEGWATGCSVVQIVTDDMPFLVDSVTAELSRLGRAINLVVHPQMVVRRDATGQLTEVLGLPVTLVEPPAYDCHLESWMHIEVDREGDPGALRMLADHLRRVLGDVRECVEDRSRMCSTATQLADELGSKPPTGLDAEEVTQAQQLLRWLADGNFTFIGYREYVLDTVDGDEALRALPGSGLGILRYDQRLAGSSGRLPPAARARARERRILILTKANSRSTVHRPAYLDYIGVKSFDEQGAVVGERRFLGLFTSGAYAESVTRVPVVDRKVAQVLRRAGFAPESHSGKDLMAILEAYPRNELFQADVDQLFDTFMSVLHLQERRRTRLFLRRDDYGRFTSCLVYLPRDRYTTAIRLRLGDILAEALGGESVDYTAQVSESVLARLHFVVRTPKSELAPDVDIDRVEARLVDAIRSWDDDVAVTLRAELGDEPAARLIALYGKAFPEAYKEDVGAAAAVADLQQLDALDGADDLGELAMSLYREPGSAVEERRLKLYRSQRVSLTQVLPLFDDLGLEVVDERPYELDRADGQRRYVYDFGLRYVGAHGWAPDQVDTAHGMFQDALAAVWHGRAESDGFNALVLGAGLSWRQVVVVRAYSKYLRQAGLTFSQSYVESCLLANVRLTRMLVQLFEARFDPGSADRARDRRRGANDVSARDETCDALVEEIRSELDDVASLDHDRILRALLGVVRATLRTSFFQVDEAGQPRSYVSFKLDPHAVPDLPAPRPAYEIWVYSPRVEGVHLRFGAVSRGGLRWSDRREDFRTEVLGLVKAQTVKNAVIVPTGAKGGFVAKALPDPGDRDAFMAEGIASYRTFVSALLDLTDNIVGTGEQARVVAPPRVVRHDGDDTYLVVAADKGTASFSDIANDVALSYGFWLGDAFASGGSAGYDHKVMGITARGAWESVKRHFRELDLDTQTQDHTVVGVGDMSGDVFGNGMLLSEHTRLVAAFDHRHVFLDPDPVAEASYVERRRLFELPRSSWADYETSLISAGGGIWPRTAKSVPVSAPAAAALGLGDQARAMTPAELMQAILRAPVDLLWNGGIGTYVKASGESSQDVGDRANDAIRVNGNELRCRVVGEGGNLGLTQLGRIEAALHGVRINTDAIDNSAGVDTSDHEVNIKILLDAVVADGELSTEQRDTLLAQMTDEVGHLVLRDNYEQNVLLGNAREQSHSMLPVHARLMRTLEKRGSLDRELEFLPDVKAIARRQGEDVGLTSPEFSLLAAYAKLTLSEDLLASDLPDDPWFASTLRDYFPAELVGRYDDRLAAHPLRREIITTSLVNNMVNRGGITFAFRVQEETAASPAQVARAYVVVREVFGLRDFAARVEALDNVVPTRAQTALYLEFRRLLDRSVRWLVQSRPPVVDVAAEIARYRTTVTALRPKVPGLLVGAEARRLARRTGELVVHGVPVELAAEAAALLDVYSLLDVTEIAASTGTPAQEVAPLYFQLSQRFQVDALLGLITRLPRDDRWDALARAALRYDLYAALESLTISVLITTSSQAPPGQRIAQWEKANGDALVRVRDMLSELSELDASGIASLSVALRGLRGLVRSGSAS